MSVKTVVKQDNKQPLNADRHLFFAQFLNMALVNIASNLMVPLAGLLDVAFLGHLSDIHHLAGVALATVLFNYLYWSFGFLRMGTTGPTAQALGRSDSDGMVLIGLRNGVIALGLGLVILALQIPLRELGFGLLGATADLKATGSAYFNAMIWGAPATLLNYVVLGWLLGRGQSKAVLLLSVVGNLTKVGLDYALIGPWAGAGAGAATALSQSLMFAVGLGVIGWQGGGPTKVADRSVAADPEVLIQNVLTITWPQVRSLLPQVLDPTALKLTLGLNGDILVRTFLLISTFSAFTILGAQLGTTVLAANTILLEVLSLAAYFIDGLAFATESWAGKLYGQGQRSQLRQLLKLSGGLSLGLGLAFALAFNLGQGPLLNRLTSHKEVQVVAAQFVVWLYPVLGFGSIAYMLDGYFLGLAAGKVVRQAAVWVAIGVVPIGILAASTHDPHILWLMLTVFMLLRALTLGVRCRETLR
jgi:multidrug resistance protein, MATE family